MKKEVKIGLTIVAGIALLYFAVTWVKHLHLFAVSSNSYQIRFLDVTGLKEGDPVTVYGYPSGNVAKIRIDGVGALVSVNLSEDIAVQTDAKAQLKVKEIMGGKLIELMPGSSGRKIAPNVEIHGETSLDFSSAFAKAGEFMDKFDVNQIDSMMQDINKLIKTFSKVADELDTVDTQGMVKDLRESAHSLNNILSDVEQRDLVASIDKSLNKVNQLSAKAEESLTSITRLTDRLGSKTLPNADSLMNQVSGMLGDSEGMIKDMSDLLKQLKNRETFAGQVLYDPSFADQLDHSLKTLDKTLDHIRTKKIYVTMTLSKGQKVFTEEPVEVLGEKVEKEK